MKPCNYAWNIELLAFGRDAEIDISRYIEEHKDSLEILGSVEQFYGCSQLIFNIPKLTLDLIGFYTIPNSHAIAEIEFASYSGKFTFWLFFKEG